MLDRLTIERAAAEAGEGPILVALSGGGDSVALLHLMAEQFGTPRLRALIVDHALRRGSAADASRAAGFARAIGVAVDVLTLSWPRGPERSQEAWRTARYAALCQRARELGARVIAVAHNADDQIETVMMRMAGGSAQRGLAGIAAFAPAPLWPEGRGVWIARPLLSVRRAALRDYLRGREAQWIEDPANANTAFERVRVRQKLAAQEATQGFDLAPLLEVTRSLRTQADALDAAARALIAAVARFERDVITLDNAHWRAAGEVRRRALSALIAAAAGAAREPAARAVARLDARLADPGFVGATLGGAELARRGDAIRISRDIGALRGRAGVAPLAPLTLDVGVAAVWDGRLELLAPGQGWRVELEGARPVLRRPARELTPDAAPWARWLLAERAAHALCARTVPATLSPSINDMA